MTTRKAKISAPNYTQVPNYLFDIMCELKEAELRVVFAIARKTFGWHRRQARLSVSLLAAMTGLSLQGVRNGIENAMERGLVTRSSLGQSFTYQILVKQVDPSTKLTSKRSRGEGVNKVDQASQRSRPKLVNEVDTLKKERKHRKKLLKKQQQHTPADAEIIELLNRLGIEEPTRTELATMKPDTAYLEGWLDYKKTQDKRASERGTPALGGGFFVKRIRDNMPVPRVRRLKWTDGYDQFVNR